VVTERAWLGLVCCLVSCSSETLSLGNGLRSLQDAAADAASEPADGARDAAPDGSPDSGSAGVFSPPLANPMLSNAESKDDDPSLTRDLTLLYFNSRREGGAGREDVWYARRDDASAAWQAPIPQVELNTDARETGIALSSDGLTIWFSSDREGGSGGLDVYVAERSDRSAAFSAPQRAVSLCSSGDDLVSAVDESQQTLYLARRSDEDDDYDLFVARRVSRDASFSEPTAVASLNSDDEESDAFPIERGARLLFTRDGDLYVATRASGADEYVSPEPIASLNSDQDDRDAWASDDFRYVVFSSDRTGSYLLYEASR